MRLAELFLTQEDLVGQAEQKLKGLKRSIEDGDSPKIWNASYTSEGHNWGDLRELGFATKSYKNLGSPRDPDAEIVAVWTYTGPETITLMTRGGQPRKMKAGDSTDY